MVNLSEYSVLEDPVVIKLVETAIRNNLASQPAHIRARYDEIKNFVLWECVKRQKSFDPAISKPVTFFGHRVYGAIKDWLRSVSPFRRSFHQMNPDVKLYVLSGANVGSDNATMELPIDTEYVSIKTNNENDIADFELRDWIDVKFKHKPVYAKLVKYRLMGFTNQEIAKKLGIPPGVVGTYFKDMLQNADSYLDT